MSLDVAINQIATGRGFCLTRKLLFWVVITLLNSGNFLCQSLARHIFFTKIHCSFLKYGCMRLLCTRSNSLIFSLLFGITIFYLFYGTVRKNSKPFSPAGLISFRQRFLSSLLCHLKALMCAIPPRVFAVVFSYVCFLILRSKFLQK